MVSSELPDLTFGVELEFMSPCPPSRQLWVRRGITAAARMNVAQQMAELTALPIACQCTHDPGHETCAICDGSESEIHDRIRVLSHGEDFARRPGSQLEQNYFLFKHEHLDGRSYVNSNRDWPGVEISSPIFQAGEWSAGLPTLNTAISALREMDAEITADESCGLHVHIGVQGGMTILLAKKIITLVMILEDSLLFDLVGTSRLANENADAINLESIMAKGEIPAHDFAEDPTGSDNLMGAHVPPMEAMKPELWNQHDPERFYDMLTKVWSSKSLQRLSMLTKKESSSRGAFDIALRDHTGLPRPPVCHGTFDGGPTTVEFRYAQMSFDIPFIRNWIEVLFHIVRIAHQSPGDFKNSLATIFELTAKTAAENKLAWDAIMEGVLGLGDRIPEWKRQRHLYHTGKEISHLDEHMLLLPPGA
ncbi:hypothetical protein G7Z17_g11731 [Cylindrodendrum hubeiense]|uniref:Amidoligase enzyme n=1 Tax=Cylindrodendrum hubeiense TaxID=595255 RepID=A0A9P5H085_9HYPO|nr:hypothetical protein G7Z17_g11731 [Cylindrodendrum hubeiense]